MNLYTVIFAWAKTSYLCPKEDKSIIEYIQIAYGPVTSLTEQSYLFTLKSENEFS